jgi:hypothetical protein
MGRTQTLNSNLIKDGDPSRLAALLGQAADDSPRWLADDLADILAHQLRAPLLFDLQRIRPTTTTHDPRAEPDPLGRPDGPEIHSLGKLFGHPSPPLALLRLTKDFAKTSDAQPGSALPPEIASMLYFAAIAAALVRLGERITALDDRALGDGVRWALAQSWIDGQTRSLFELAAHHLAIDRRTEA